MRTPFASIEEESGAEEPTAVTSPSDDLHPRDYTIVGKLFEGRKAPQIAKEMGLSTQAVNKTLDRPAVKAYIARIGRAQEEQISRGEFGSMAILKSEQVKMVKRLVKMAKYSEDEKIRYNAIVKVLELGGMQPPKPQVTENVERLIDAMTAEEAEEFAATGTFPERFRDQMARLATNVLKEGEARRWDPKIEIEGE